MEELTKILENISQAAGAEALTFLLKLAIAIVVYIVIRIVTKKFCHWLNERLKPTRLDDSIRSFLISLIRVLVTVGTITTIIIQLNIVQATSIAALVASAGVGISLALQGVLSNFAGGILILFLKPFRTGDYIGVTSSGLEGTIVKIEMYYTTIRSVENTTCLIPNSSLTGNAIVNYTALQHRKLNLTVDISYDADLRKAKQVLQKVLEEDPRILKEDLQVFVDSLADSSVKLGCRGFVPTEVYWQTRWDVNEKIKLALDAAGIEIPYNQLDVHLNTGDHIAD